MDAPVDAPPVSELEAKWGESLKAGYQVLPNSLIRGQHLLGLTAVDVVVIANLNQAWWQHDHLPFVAPQTIAKRMSVSERTVQRSLSRLREKGFLRQVKIDRKDGLPLYAHDLSGLRRELEMLARRDIQYSDSRRATNARGG